MRENVGKFFERYAEDEALRGRIAEAQANYPGSLEIREAVVEDVKGYRNTADPAYRIFRIKQKLMFWRFQIWVKEI